MAGTNHTTKGIDRCDYCNKFMYITDDGDYYICGNDMCEHLTEVGYRYYIGRHVQPE